jgi:hypothetical protein
VGAAAAGVAVIERKGVSQRREREERERGGAATM